jgi:hypothetical protein
MPILERVKATDPVTRRPARALGRSPKPPPGRGKCLAAFRVGAKATVQIARLDRAARLGSGSVWLMVPVAISGSVFDFSALL